MSQQDPGEELDEDSKKLKNQTCTSESTRSKRGARKQIEGTFERKRALLSEQDPGEEPTKDSRKLFKKHALASQQDQGEEPDEDSRTLLKGNMY